MGEHITFPSNGSEGQGYLAVPAAGSGPGVIVIQEWWGLVDHIRDVCDRFAGEGFVALAPDLYRGEHTDEPDEAGKLMMSLDMARAGKDMTGAVRALAARPEVTSATVGVIGFCMGGGLVLWLAAQGLPELGAAVPFYGVIPPQAGTPDWSRVNVPVQGHYAEHDDFASPEAVARMREEMEGAGCRVEIFTYPGTKHAFFNDTDPFGGNYDAGAAGQAWDRALAFLRTHVS